MYLDIHTISKIISGKLIGRQAGNKVAKGISTDTRTLKAGQVFFALRGQHFDGHNYLAKAQASQALAAVVDHHVEDSTLPQIIVADCLDALHTAANKWRNQLTAQVVLITGSNGKTTVKEILCQILRSSDKEDSFHYSRANQNNHIGLPLTLLKAQKKHRYIIAEAGMNHSGELSLLSQIAQPNLVLINNAGRAHLGNFASLKEVAKAKGEIITGLLPNSTAVLNADDPHYPLWKDTADKQSCTVVAFGQRASNASVTVTEDKIYIGNYPVTIPLLGAHNLMNAAAAITVAQQLKISNHQIIKGLKRLVAVAGRLCPHPLKNGSLLIDDSYNANPDSALIALATLQQTAQDKNLTPLFVLGDMLELGDNATAYHQEIIDRTQRLGVELLGTGELMGNCLPDDQHFSSKPLLIAHLQEKLQNQPCCILVKGSRAMRMEDIVQPILQTAGVPEEIEETAEAEAGKTTGGTR